jgi:hypothetical protein
MRMTQDDVPFVCPGYHGRWTLKDRTVACRGGRRPGAREGPALIEQEGTLALLERLRHEERASWGVDPDSTSYLDAADRIELARAAYRARLDEEESGTVIVEERRVTAVVVTAELL